MAKIRKFWVSREELFDILESGRFPLPQFHEDYLNQAVKTTSSPTFAGLTINGNIAVTGTVDGVDVAALKTDVDGFHDDLKNLTATEIEELARIGATTISIAQWGYLGACSAGGGQLLAALTAAESTQLEAIGGATISAAQWGYLGAMGDWLDQAVKQASSPVFATVKLSALTDGYVPYHVNDAAGLANSGVFWDSVNSRVGIGTSSPNCTLNIVHPNTAAGGLMLQTTIADATQKDFRFKVAHYTNAQPPITLMLGTSLIASSTMKIGGGSGLENAMTHIQFYTAANNTTLTGTERMRIDSAGQIGIGKIPTEKLDVDGNIKADTFLLAAGVTPNIGWLSDVNIDSWEQGETLLWDADTGNLVDAWGVEYDNPRLVWKMYTEFMGYSIDASPPWTAGTIAGGTKAGISGLANHPGILNFLSSTTANSGYRFAIEADAILLAGKESTELIFQMKTNDDTRVKFGFIDTYGSGDPVDGVWLDILGGVLTGKTANNSAISTTGTNFNIVADTWYRMKLFINNAVNLVTYSLYTCADDTIRWTNTLAANIPTARVTGHGIIATHSEEFVVSIIWVDMMTANRAGAWNR